MRLLIMGAPGAGKGTQAVLIKNEYSIPHISTGDMFREAISQKTELGVEAKKFIDQGLLVPDSLTVELVRARLSQPDCEKGFILDGFPRNISQAEFLSEVLKQLNMPLDAVLDINVDNSVLLARIVGRRVCPKCGASFHINNAKPKVDGICDYCSSELIHRKDDTEETVSNRLKVYEAQTAPLLDYYKNINLLKVIKGIGDINDIFNNIKEVLGGLK